MKLSEAIRVGAKLHPQGFGDTRKVTYEHSWLCLFGFRRCRQIVNTCALGAAFEAGECGVKEGATGGNAFRGGPTSSGSVVDVPQEWLTTLYYDWECPQCGVEQPLYRLIPHLNDDHKWKREEIALQVGKAEDYHQLDVSVKFDDEPYVVNDVLEAEYIDG